jgi:hypothetical protein
MLPSYKNKFSFIEKIAENKEKIQFAWRLAYEATVYFLSILSFIQKNFLIIYNIAFLQLLIL